MRILTNRRVCDDSMAAGTIEHCHPCIQRLTVLEAVVGLAQGDGYTMRWCSIEAFDLDYTHQVVDVLALYDNREWLNYRFALE